MIVDGPDWDEMVVEAEAETNASFDGPAGSDGGGDGDGAKADGAPPLLDSLLQGLQGVIAVINATDPHSIAATISIVRRSAAATRARGDGVFPFLVVLVTQLDMVMLRTAQVVDGVREKLRPVLSVEGWPETGVAFIGGSGTAPDAENMLGQALQAVITHECRWIPFPLLSLSRAPALGPPALTIVHS